VLCAIIPFLELIDPFYSTLAIQEPEEKQYEIRQFSKGMSIDKESAFLLRWKLISTSQNI